MVKLLNYFFGYEKEEIVEKFAQVYQKREGSDSSGGFGFERTGKINSRTLSKIFQKE